MVLFFRWIYGEGFRSITFPLNGPALETASINAVSSIVSDAVIHALACS